MEDSFSWVYSSLSSDERVLWRGKPERIRLFEASDLFMIPFSLFWAGIAFYMEYRTITGGAPFFFTLFGSFFVLVGLYITVGRFVYKSFILKRTAYAVTSKKVLINRNGKIDLLMKNSLPSFTIKRDENGSGTIKFKNSRTLYGFDIMSNPFLQSGGFTISCVENVGQVVKAIQARDG